MTTVKQKLSEKIGKAAGDIIFYATVGLGIAFICGCCIGVAGTIIDGFNSVMTGVVGR